MISHYKFSRGEGFWLTAIAAALSISVIAVPSLFPRLFVEPAGRAPNQGQWFSAIVLAICLLAGIRFVRWYLILAMAALSSFSLARGLEPEARPGWYILAVLAGTTSILLLAPPVRRYLARVRAERSGAYGDFRLRVTGKHS